MERNVLSQHRSPQEYLRSREGVITAVAVGGFFILVGMMFVIIPDLWDNINAFFQNITTQEFPFGDVNSVIALPAPLNPAAHNALYNALMQFDIGFGVLQIIILALRLAWHSRVSKVAETVGNLVFWLGAALLVNVFLLQGTLAGWWQYWGALIILVGISFVAWATVNFVKR